MFTNLKRFVATINLFAWEVIMEERFEIKSIFKSNNPEELIVFKANSSEDEIRFYFNDEQYVSAKDNYNGTFSINYGEDEKEKNDIKSESNLLIIKENLKEYCKSIFFDLDKVEILCFSIIFISLLSIICNILVCLLIIHCMRFIIEIIAILTIIYKNKPISLKSKHSAEHMMYNFLEEKKRLPKDISEIKNISRFTDDCSSRKITIGYTSNFIQNVFTSLISVCIGSYITQNSKNDMLLFVFIYIVIGFIVWILKKSNKLDFIIKPVNKILNNLVQCCNTTRKVEDTDIILAYYVAKEWMKIVYPEFYNEDEDTFYECDES